MDKRGACLICSAPISFTHLGVKACRACTSFFKRTELEGHTFKCRQGDRKCKIRKHEKFLCHSCHYDKCAELLMSSCGRSQQIPRSTAERAVESASSSTSSLTISTSFVDRMDVESLRNDEAMEMSEADVWIRDRRRLTPSTTLTSSNDDCEDSP